MNVTQRAGRGRSLTWGWGIVATLCLLLILNAAWLYVAAGTPGLFEADTGISAVEFRAAYPSVADELAGRGRTIALLLAGLGALGLTVSIAGRRAADGWARTASWVLAAVLLAVAANALAGGRAEVGFTYLAMAAVAAAGLLLVRRGAKA